MYILNTRVINTVYKSFRIVTLYTYISISNLLHIILFLVRKNIFNKIKNISHFSVNVSFGATSINNVQEVTLGNSKWTYFTISNHLFTSDIVIRTNKLYVSYFCHVSVYVYMFLKIKSIFTIINETQKQELISFLIS